MKVITQFLFLLLLLLTSFDSGAKPFPGDPAGFAAAFNGDHPDFVAPPVNDDCANAITLTPGVSCVGTAGTNVEATQSIAPITCGIFTSSSSLDVWYKFVATATAHVVTVVGGTGFDAIIDVRSGACPGTNIACADATTGGGTEVATAGGLTIGNTYLVRVYGWAGGTGTFTICVTGAPMAPANDDCANATTLTSNVSCSPTAGTNVNATQSIAPITCASFTSSSSLDVWYKFTAVATTQTITVVGGTGFDAIIDVRSGACNGTNIACADATTGGGTEVATASGLTVGNTYLVRVYGWAGGTGTFTICVTGTPAASAPANDNCAGAATLTPGTICTPSSGTTVGATSSLAAITCATFTGTADDDVWYQFTATSTSHNVTVVGSAGFDAVIDVRTGACNGTNIACADATVSGGTETVTLNGLTVGATYLVRVYSFGSTAGNQGTFTICVTTPAPANNECATATTLTSSTVCSPTSGTTVAATQSLAAISCNTFTGTADDDVWYQFTAVSATHTVTVVGSAGFDAVVDVRSGACPGVNIGCADAAVSGGTETVTLNSLTPGTTYFVRVYSFNSTASSQGTFTICVTHPSGSAPGCLANPTSPTNGQTGVCPGPVTLSWPAEPNATSYDVYFGTAATPPFFANTVGTTFNAGTLAAGTYFWQIRPRNAIGVASGCAVWLFTVGDNTAPTITCPPSVVANNATGQCAAVVTYGSVSATDNCSAPNIVLVSGQASGASFPVGTTAITFRATDAAGNSSTCSFTVKVNDTQAPNITCPASVSANNAPGLCSAVVTYGSVGASDNCTAPLIVLVSGQASGSTFPVGATVQTFRATDAAGNSSTCSFTVTVIDNQIPVITCPASVTLNNTPNICGRVVTYTTPVGTDNCAVTTTQLGGLASGSLFPVGTTTNIFRAVDASNNSASCQFQIKIVDAQPPSITCPPNRQAITDGFDCQATGIVLGLPTITDNCTVSGPATNNAPAAYPVGTTNVTWVVSDPSGNTASCQQQVTVIDLQIPVIQCPAATVQATVDASLGNCTAVVDYNVVAYDNCPGLVVTYNFPPQSEFPLNYTLVQASATDASGNTNACSFLVLVKPGVEVCNGLDDDCDGQVDESDDWKNVGREEASDGLPGEEYGTSVDVDGDYAVVGSKDKNPTGQTTGAAYLLHRDGPNDWVQVLKMSPTGLEAGDNFGAAVALGGPWAAVGAPGDDDVATNAGAVYLFQQSANDPGQWPQFLKLTLPAGTAEDNFGSGLSLHGDYLLVGAINDDETAMNSGAVYVFGRNQGGANAWGLVKKLKAPNGQSVDMFGADIDFDGAHAIVSAPGDDEQGGNAGAAYIFGRNTGGTDNWGLDAKVLATNGKAGDNFGADVGISGGFALVGADQNDEKAPNAGKAYLFYQNTGGANHWGQSQSLIDLNGKADDNFGAAVGIDGDYAVVGAPGTDFQIYAQNPGKAVVYQRLGNSWSAVDELTDGPSHSKNDRFGTETAISNRVIIVGVPLDNLGPNSLLVDKGSVTFFEGVCLQQRSGDQPAEETLTDGALQIKCFPVPFSDKLTIGLWGATVSARISMVNSLGQEVAVLLDGAVEESGTQTEWEAGNYPPGVYFVRVQTADGVQTQAVNLVRR